jgi:hypothetical protein
MTETAIPNVRKIAPTTARHQPGFFVSHDDTLSVW